MKLFNNSSASTAGDERTEENPLSLSALIKNFNYKFPNIYLSVHHVLAHDTSYRMTIVTFVLSVTIYEIFVIEMRLFASLSFRINKGQIHVLKDQIIFRV